MFPFLIFSQVNDSKVSPVHAGTFSNNTISYVVGKIYVIPPPVLNKQYVEKEQIANNTNNIKVYPNPVNDVLTIETLDKSEIKFIAISDMSGKLICSNKLENNSIDVSYLKRGVYSVTFDNDKTKKFKIIKN